MSGVRLRPEISRDWVSKDGDRQLTVVDLRKRLGRKGLK